MARRRRPTVDQPPRLHVYDDEPVRARDRVDARAYLIAPEDVADDAERLLLWARLNAPRCVLSDDRAALARDYRVRRGRLADARDAARRSGVRAPDPRDFPMPGRLRDPA
jgi:hypothetical protein